MYLIQKIFDRCEQVGEGLHEAVVIQKIEDGYFIQMEDESMSTVIITNHEEGGRMMSFSTGSGCQCDPPSIDQVFAAVDRAGTDYHNVEC